MPDWTWVAAGYATVYGAVAGYAFRLSRRLRSREQRGR